MRNGLRKGSNRLRLLAVGAVGAVGAALIYFLDPDQGPQRREAARRWVVATYRGGTGRVPAPDLVETVSVPLRVVRAPESERPVGHRARPAAAASGAGDEAEAPQPTAFGAAAPFDEQEIVLIQGGEHRAPEIVSYDDAGSPPLPTLTLPVEPRQPPAPSAVAETTPRPFRRRASYGPLLALTAAAACAAVGLGIWAVARSGDSAPRTETRALDDQAQAIALLSRPDTERLPLAGSKGTMVLVVAKNGQSVLIISDVPRAPDDKIYEAWLIAGKKKPRPAGLFDGGGRQTVVPLTVPVPRKAVVAVTLEPVPGSDAPTGTPLYSAEF